ncbi:MAG: hypothetical protein HUU02_11125 [Bacteroidetes bacterium]|nr:hypothetical protein [Bacteroidota bacterium]
MAGANRTTYYLLIMVCMLLPSLLSAQQGKCGTWRTFERMKARTGMPDAPVVIVRPERQTSKLSPRGLFRVHYDTVDVHAPALVNANGVRIAGTYHQYADSVLAIFDQVYGIEVEQYGFKAPAADAGAGGGNEYDIYIWGLSTNEYGYIEFDETNLTPGKTNPQYACFVNIDNDYSAGYYTVGMNALRVTAAHEFHHLVQVSTSGAWFDDFYFYELSSTALESTVYPGIRDYLQYIKTYFNNTLNWPLFIQTARTGYERAVFGKYLMEKYDPAIMGSIWEEVRTYRPARSLQHVLNARGSSLEREFSEFALWCYYTNHRSDSAKYFTDAAYYPLVKSQSVTSLVGSSVSIQGSSGNFTMQFQRAIAPGAVKDTADVIITYSNGDDAISGKDIPHAYLLEWSPVALSGSTIIAPSLHLKFTASDAASWKYHALGKGGLVRPAGVAAFPVPLDPAASSLLMDIGAFADPTSIDLTILSLVTQDVVYQGKATITSFSGIQYAEWKGRDERGALASSGVYMFILSQGSTVVKGKFAVIR